MMQVFVQVMAGVFIILFAVPSYRELLKSQGRKRGGIILALLGLFALGFEYLALNTGWPYGGFRYGDLLAPKIGGVLPVTVAIAWPPMILGVVTIAEKITNNKWLKVFVALGFLIWVDLVVDPGAVATGMWRYGNTYGFYGVPYSNFAGWIVSGLVGILIVLGFVKQKVNAQSSLKLILVIWTGVAIWFGLWVPAGLGIVLIGLILAIIRRWRKLS